MTARAILDDPRPRTVRLHVPPPPQSWHPNARAHWSRKRRDANDYALEVKSAITQQQYDHPKWGVTFARARLDLSFVFPKQRRRDGDNLIAWAKPLIDLLKRQFLVDDDLAHLEIGTVQATVVPKMKPCVVVTLTELQQVSEQRGRKR